MRYNKLVRDLIPDIIRKNGGEPISHIATPEEFSDFCRKKLREEVDEYLSSGDIEELADILEVIDALCGIQGTAREELLSIQEKKRVERGGFSRRIILEEV